MNVYTKTKFLFKFGILEIMCVEMRLKKNNKKLPMYLLRSIMKGSISRTVNSISLTMISIHQELNYFQMSISNKE